MPSTMRDVAARAGVSVTTVSHVLNQTPHRPIAADTRKRILEAVRELSYYADANARHLAQHRSRVRVASSASSCPKLRIRSSRTSSKVSSPPRWRAASTCYSATPSTTPPGPRPPSARCLKTRCAASPSPPPCSTRHWPNRSVSSLSRSRPSDRDRPEAGSAS